MQQLLTRAEEDLAIDDIKEIFKNSKKASQILYLHDNAGEIVFDTLLIRELRELGATVTAVVKGAPVLNDATEKDAHFVKLAGKVDKLITTGTDAVGYLPHECSKEFLSSYNTTDFVIAKGMGYAETIPEHDLSIPHALLFRTKCLPVANFFKIRRGRNIAKLLVAGPRNDDEAT
jgi:uncharacterized protein with ATP-grasp and redox domains